MRLGVKVEYDKREIKILESNLNISWQMSLIENFLREQTGKGEGKSKINEEDVYYVTLTWNPENDAIKCTYNTGNKGLRDGILYATLRKFSRLEETCKLYSIDADRIQEIKENYESWNSIN